jgi:signal transduction histidine kinase
MDTDTSIRERLQTQITSDFREEVMKASAISQTQLDQFKSLQSLEREDENVRLLVNKDCRLLAWSNAELMPSARSHDELCDLPSFNTYSEEGKVYYQLRHENEDHLLITLIPIHVTYRVQNSFLPTRVFLGRYTQDPNIVQSTPEMEVHLRKTVKGIHITDANDRLVFSLVVPHPEVFTFGRRSVLMLMAMVTFSLLLVWLGTWLNRKVNPLVGALVVSALVLGARATLLAIGFPGTWAPGQLFSPTLLAIDQLSPSLGDFTLNVVTVLTCLLLLSRALRGKAGMAQVRWVRGTWAAVVIPLVAAFCSAWLLHSFFSIFQSVLVNSKINFDFSNVFRLNGWSYLAFIDMGLVLVCLQVLLLRLGKAAYLSVPERWRLALFPGQAVATAIFLWLMQPSPATEMVAGSLAVVGTLLVTHRLKGLVYFKLDFLNLITTVIVFSLLSTTSVMRGDRTRKFMEMEILANRVADEHDRITESLFDRVESDVTDHTYELDFAITSDTLLGDVIPWLEDKFLPNFKGYNVRLYLYDDDGKRVAENTKDKPISPYGNGLKLEDVGEVTTSQHLRWVPNYDNFFERTYLGQFDLVLRNIGRLVVQVELEPRELQPNRLYPQLMLDDKVRTKSNAAGDIEYALYLNKKIFRKAADEAFPVFYAGSDSNTASVTQGEHGAELNYFHKAGSQRTVHVRTRAAGLFEAINLFSFVFYFFILVAGSFFLITRLPQVLRNPSRLLRMSLRVKIQVFLLGITILPLVTVVFFLSPYVKERIYEDMRKELRSETARVASLVRDDYLLVRKPGVASGGATRILKNKLEDIEKTIFNDINIYDNRGRIHLTTQRFIYEMGLTSEYMNPVVYEQMRNGEMSDMVVEDQIGNVTYFSGYYPILTDESRIVGFLNIPYLKNPDQVDEQSLGLMTFLVDLYVVVFLAMGFIALIISNSITRPLTLLSDKLRGLALGKANEPLQWNSTDEIGEIISSYNQMLEKLAESEKKLARNEREMAWKQMARQVAHEIKNPLTPMKLSVQHLVRAWNEGGDRLPTMFEKVTRTLLVQIDSLVRIADSFSQFASMPEQNRDVFILQDVIREVVDLYSSESKVQIQLDLPQAPFYVASDRDQLSRVFNNLVKNGIQAIEEQGKISVKLEAGDAKCTVTVADNGQGVPEDIRGRIFEPNFSTKTSGMGLGLAIVKKIIEGAEGKIWFESTTGEGTTFFIELPRAQAPA